MAAQARAAAYSFGVAPTLPAARLEAIFAPIGGELGRALDRGIEYRSAATFEQFAARLALQEFDIAHVHPFDYVRIAAKHGYLPVARLNDVLAAAAVVREDSSLRELKDLRGAQIAMPPGSGSASYLGRTLLAEAGLDPAKDVTVSSAEDAYACLHRVMIGAAAACIVGSPAVRLYEAQTGVRLRTVARSPSIPQSLFVVHARVPREERELIGKTLVRLSLTGLTPELRDLLPSDARQPFVPAEDADYEVVRRILRQLEGRK